MNLNEFISDPRFFYSLREKERERDTYLSYYVCENLHSLYIDGFGYDR